MNSKDVIRKLEADGWSLIRTKGSHHHFKHPTKPGLVTVRIRKWIFLKER